MTQIEPPREAAENEQQRLWHLDCWSALLRLGISMAFKPAISAFKVWMPESKDSSESIFHVPRLETLGFRELFLKSVRSRKHHLTMQNSLEPLSMSQTCEAQF